MAIEPPIGTTVTVDEKGIRVDPAARTVRAAGG